MIEVCFIHPDGRTEVVTAPPGDSVMDAALDNGVAGILGQCGGGCTCCTCHCWVASPWFEHLAVPHPDETDMLEYAWGRASNSRLSCQVKLDESMQGIKVSIPTQQA